MLFLDSEHFGISSHLCAHWTLGLSYTQLFFKKNNSSHVFSFCGWAIFLDAFFGDLYVHPQSSCKKLLEPYLRVQSIIYQSINADKLKQKPQICSFLIPPASQALRHPQGLLHPTTPKSVQSPLVKAKDLKQLCARINFSSLSKIKHYTSHILSALFL